MKENDIKGYAVLFALIVVFWGAIVAFLIDLLQKLLIALLTVVIVAGLIVGIWWFGDDRGWW